MRRLICAGATVALLAACGDGGSGDLTADEGQGGNGGTAGQIGIGGTAGHGGSGGTAGHGGSGGTGGRGGNGGTAGRGGNGGTAGHDAGQGGTAGVTSDAGPDAGRDAGSDAGPDSRPDAAAPCEPTPEVCDGLDNDCDGEADEDLTRTCYDGPAGTASVGPCVAGETLCMAGAWQPCMGQSLPGDEICDGADNDCDGATDDGDLPAGACLCVAGAQRPCYAGPAGTEGLGPCAGGLQVCNADGQGWGACVGQTLPADDICDGADNDCDGTADDAVVGAGMACAAGVGECLSAGLTQCDAATGQVVCGAVAGAPAAELCNGLDDDCDGVTDDGFDLGAVCSVGVGACAATGATVCDPATLAATCSAAPTAPMPETCDGLDNDCDGQADDGFDLGAACSVGVGACAVAGVNVCDAAALATTCSATAGVPAPETCDGLDNDCDGEADEGCFVRIEPGVFTMGSPPNELGRFADETQHQVTISRAFAMKVTEVTQAEWLAVMGDNPSTLIGCGGNCPVEEVSWNDAIDYTNRLSDMNGFARCYDADRNFAGLDCQGYRLPTEAEWEYAARAGTQTAYHTGRNSGIYCMDLDANLDLAGWYCGNSFVNATRPVALKQANAWGLYDMHGNVWEWVQDRYAPYSGAAVDPVGADVGVDRASRGGCWNTYAMDARAARRGRGPVDFHGSYIGFRPARTLP